jgi:hypothetical protein
MEGLIGLAVLIVILYLIVRSRSKHAAYIPPANLPETFSIPEQNIIDKISDYISAEKPPKNANEDVLAIAQAHNINETRIKSLAVRAWENSLDKFFEDNILSEAEEETLTSYQDYYEFNQADLDKRGYYTKLVKGGVLRDLMEGKIPERVEIKNGMPFILGKDEKLIWYFKNVKREYVGRSKGVSVKVMKGVYYRTGSFKGNPVDTTITAHIDNGVLAITNKNILFAGSAKSVKIPYAKLLSLMPYEDGVQISRNTASAKPQYFLTGDGWFTYNLLSNLTQN